MWSSRSDSSCAMRVTGMPVHIATTWAMSSSPTTGTLDDCWVCQSERSWSTSARAEVSASRSCWARSYSWSLTAASFSLETRSSSFWAAFSGYGAIKKHLQLESVASLFLETLIVAPFMLQARPVTAIW